MIKLNKILSAAVKYVLVQSCITNIVVCSEKCIVRQFCHCMNITEYTYTNFDELAWALLYGILLRSYKLVQNVTVLNIAGNCNTIVFVHFYYIIL